MIDSTSYMTENTLLDVCIDYFGTVIFISNEYSCLRLKYIILDLINMYIVITINTRSIISSLFLIYYCVMSDYMSYVTSYNSFLFKI